MRTRLSSLLVLALALASAACETPTGLDDCRNTGTIDWCGTKPPSGDCDPVTETGCAYSASEAAALRHFFATITGETGGIWKWENDIRLQVMVGTAAEVQLLEDAAREMRAASGRAISIVPSGGNVRVHFVPKAVFPTIINNPSPTAAGITHYEGANYRLTGGIIVVGTDSTVNKPYVTVHELAHMVGMMGHVTEYASIMNSVGVKPIDRVTLRALYRSDITPGMTAEEALAVLGID